MIILIAQLCFYYHKHHDPSNSLASRSGSDGTSTTPEIGGTNPYIGKQCLLPHSTLLWKFYVSCDGITMGFRF